MKKLITVLLVIGIFICTGCVQKAHLKTVIVTLTIPNQKNIVSAGIRGNGNPLSWEQDFPLTPFIKDSVYMGNFKTMTAFKFTEAKFTVNGGWELENQPNRKIMYDDNKDTVFVNAVFNQP